MKTKITTIEKAIGGFILAAAALVCAFLIFQIHEGRVFQRKFILYTVTDTGHGLGIGSKVLYNGISAGVVEEVNVTEDNRIKISFSIQRQFEGKIMRGSRALIMEPMILGSTEINIIPGAAGGRPLENGDMLPAEVPPAAFAKFENIPDSVTNLLTKANNVMDNTSVLLKNLSAITDSLTQRQGSVGELLNDNKKLYNSVDELLNLTRQTINSSQDILKKVDATAAQILEASKSIPEITQMVKDELANLKTTQKSVEDITTNLGKMTENLTFITDKVAKGEGSLGKLINDPSLYNTAKDAVDSTRSIVESIKQTKTYVGVDTDYYGGRDVTIMRFHLKVVPREARYFLLGGALYMGVAEEEKNGAADEETTFDFKPEFLVAQKIFENKLTVRGGLFEGKLGGGVDYAPWGEDNYRFILEGRDVYTGAEFNEGLDRFLLRFKVDRTLFTYFHAEIGVDDIMNDPSFFIGIGFEYLDEDITKVVGLISAGK